MTSSLQRLINHKQPRKFQLGDKLYAKNFYGNKWIPVKVTKVTGPLSYQVETDAGIVLRRHVDHLRYRYPDDNGQSDNTHSSDASLDTSHPDSISDDDDWVMPNAFNPPHESDDPVEPPAVPDTRSHSPTAEPEVPAPSPDVTSARGRPLGAPVRRPTPSRIPIRHSTRTRPPMERYSPSLQTKRGGVS